MIAVLAHHAMTLLTADPATDDTGGGESKKSGPIGIVVIIVLCVACYFLFKSLSKHLRAVREGSLTATPDPLDGRDGRTDGRRAATVSPVPVAAVTVDDQPNDVEAPASDLIEHPAPPPS